MAFLYFFPGMNLKQVNRDWLRDSPVKDPLRDIWERGEGFQLLHKTEVNNGPEGLPGVMIAAIRDDEQNCGFYKAHQTWHNVGTHWIGIDDRYPPNAVRLERRKIIPGVDEELAAGGIWHLPIIRQPSAESPLKAICCLPFVVTSGHLDGAPHKIATRFLPVWELATKVFLWIFCGVPLDESKAASAKFLQDAAATLLGVNYRVGPEEVLLLECMEVDDIITVLRTAIAADDVDAAMKQTTEQSAA